eukprot:TRINITY_DN6488_c0_g1_i2.p1 TRINITY_DN6488_c0_g1~~TRINITY_DN6488_c0_g1_i2.p1  ORF type:complete len:345 (+),score=28.16 TRINITY_DN6488_c0_g1_i2:57-1037(+)
MPSWPLRSVALLGLARYLHAAPVKLIIDTDIGGGGCRDVDDIGALAVAHALADSGEVDLLAVVLNTNPQPCAGVISVLNTYYNRQHLPIGAYKGPGLDPNSPFWPYVTDLVENFPSAIKNASQVPDAVEVYRRMLASQPDRSVTISSIGILTNLAALLRSGPDDISPLSGRELMARKVKLVAAMAVDSPTEKSSAFATVSMPQEVKVTFSGLEVGLRVVTGTNLRQCASPSSPVRRAYIDYVGDKGRFSWDLITTLVAIRGAGAAGCSECTDCNGSNKVNATTGTNKWTPGPKTNQTYLLLHNATFARDTIDELLCRPPKGAAVVV